MEEREPDCAKCGKYYGAPERGLCSSCYATWCCKNGYSASETCKTSPCRVHSPRSPNAVVDRVLRGNKDDPEFQPMKVSDSLLAQLKALLKNHAYTPIRFLRTVREMGIVDADGETPNKLFTARQAGELMNERKTKVHDEKQGYVWEHVICYLVADYWNIPENFRVGHCYYSDWGTPPRSYNDNMLECRAQMIERCIGRSSMVYRETTFYK